jgi:hypothetical protein
MVFFEHLNFLDLLRQLCLPKRIQLGLNLFHAQADVLERSGKGSALLREFRFVHVNLE